MFGHGADADTITLHANGTVAMSYGEPTTTTILATPGGWTVAC